MRDLVRGNSAPVPRLLKRLYDHRALIDEIFHQREIYVEAHEPRFGIMEQLQRERIVRLDRDATGASVRLASHVRQMVSAATRDQVLQRIDAGVQEELERIRHLADAWRREEAQGEYERAEAIAEEITEALEDIELRYAEQLERLDDRINSDYGFNEHTAQRVRDYRYYIERLRAMHEGAETLLNALRAEDFDGIAFIERLATKLDTRFRRHGQTILALLATLQRYIHTARARQAQARRNRRFLQWLRRQPGTPRLAAAETAATVQPSLQRAAPLTISGVPDLGDRLLEPEWLALQGGIDRHRRRLERSRRRIVRESSGRREDAGQTWEQAREAERRRRDRVWDSHAWTQAYLREVVRAARDAGEGVEVSAGRFWRGFEPPAALGPQRPSYRAWLAAIVFMAFNNRKTAGARPFFSDFEIRLEPTLPEGVSREPEKLRDIHVRVRENALRQRRNRATEHVG